MPNLILVDAGNGKGQTHANRMSKSGINFPVDKQFHPVVSSFLHNTVNFNHRKFKDIGLNCPRIILHNVCWIFMGLF